MTNGPAIVPEIVIEGMRNDWPGGRQTFWPLRPERAEPNKDTFWFGARLKPAGNQVWFRITMEAVRRMQEETPSPILAVTAYGPRVVPGNKDMVSRPARVPLTLQRL